MIAGTIGRLLSLALCVVVAPLAGCASTPFTSETSGASWTFDRVETLPEPGPLNGVTLADALAHRRSIRTFTADPLTAEQSAALMWAAQGVTASWGGRTAPSAGARYPLDVYLVTGEGIRHYVPDGHRAEVRASTTARAALVDAVGQDPAASAPTMLVITGTPDRLKPKYLLRAERYTYMEAGHAAQNVLLASTALGLGAVPIGAFDQAAAAGALGLPDGQEPIYVIPIGLPSSGQ